MNILTLEQIKAQCRIDPEMTEEDSLLELYGDAAEEIEVLVAVLVEDVDALAALHGDGHTDVVAVEVLVTVFDDFRIGLELFDHGRVLLLKFYVCFTI